MSYVCWFGSDWYVYWEVGHDEPTCTLWHCDNKSSLPVATYAQLKGITEDALAKLVPGAPREAVAELLRYVREFCAAVERNTKDSFGDRLDA